MNSNRKLAIVAVAALTIGLLVGRETNNSDSPTASHKIQTQLTFEKDALGFINWYRIQGRDEIPHEVLTQNLGILESKAIASGKLITFRKSE